MTNLDQIRVQIEHYSRFINKQLSSTTDLKDELLEIASEIRSRDSSYRLEYIRPDAADFRLRSKDSPGEQAFEKTIHFLEPGRRLHLVLEDLSEEEFEGLSAELTIIGEHEKQPNENAREPELNLLMARTFQAELYAEFQRLERYNTPFFTTVIHLKSNVDWKPAAKELKHVGKRRDIFGRLTEDSVAGLFPSRKRDDLLPETLRKRLDVRYSQEEMECFVLHLPTDCSDWGQLQALISRTDSTEERDTIGNR